ncbi:TIGR03943 family putative permease subunit [Knoellia sp. CPCC 206453]|uniref:TIGR03943 family putative permease subunit n=1 Tax=Knoellia pratensis TaxID=3404796 RepID=UPI0036072CFF
MNKTMQSTALSVIGVIAVVAALGGLYLNFVKPVMRWPIIAAALVLIGVAIIGLIGHERVRGRRQAAPVAPYESMEPGQDSDAGAHSHSHSHSHDHGKGPRIGWLLIVPFVLLGVATPGPLGAFSAERDSGRIATNGEPPLFDPLEGGDERVGLAVGEYAMRALYDDPKNLEGKTFSLTGFASELADGEGWALTRMSLSCCAGDAQAIKVRVVGAPAPADNEWVTLTGTWKKAATPADAPETLPVIEASNLQPISAPANPYE